MNTQIFRFLKTVSYTILLISYIILQISFLAKISNSGRRKKLHSNVKPLKRESKYKVMNTHICK